MKKRILLVALIVLNGCVLFYLFRMVKGVDNRPFTVEQVVPALADTVPVRQTAPLPQYAQEIPVRDLVPLSGTSRQFVFDLRKEAVAASPFAQEDYKPLDAVFGGIVSGKPWYALSICRLQEHALTDGPSEETRFINNPTALVALTPSFIYINHTRYAWCTKSDYNTLIQKITFDGPRKEITVTYLDLPDYRYLLNGINARDLGYPFAYIDKARSTYDISFPQENNIGANVYEFRDFIHVGGSCSVAGGCNNGSPYQPEAEFEKPAVSSCSPREIYLKLWKERPQTPQDEPDLVERMIILPPASCGKKAV